MYGSCVKPINRDSRPCTYYNRCKRGSWSRKRGQRGQFFICLRGFRFE
jgi:hypothetical protein